MLKLSSLASTLVLALCWQAMASGLTERLEIRRTQSGFAGEAGTLVVIEPSGAWTRQQITRGKADPVEVGNSGTLSAEQMDELAKALEDNGFAALPGELGANTRANPKKLTIRLGDKMVEMVTPAAPGPTAEAPSDATAQAEAIAATVEELTKGQ